MFISTGSEQLAFPQRRRQRMKCYRQRARIRLVELIDEFNFTVITSLVYFLCENIHDFAVVLSFVVGKCYQKNARGSEISLKCQYVCLLYFKYYSY